MWEIVPGSCLSSRIGRRQLHIAIASLALANFVGFYLLSLATLGRLDWTTHIAAGSVTLAAVIGLGMGWLVTQYRAESK